MQKKADRKIESTNNIHRKHQQYTLNKQSTAIGNFQGISAILHGRTIFLFRLYSSVSDLSFGWV